MDYLSPVRAMNENQYSSRKDFAMTFFNFNWKVEGNLCDRYAGNLF